MATGLIYIVSASAVGKEIIGSFLVHSAGALNGKALIME